MSDFKQSSEIPESRVEKLAYPRDFTIPLLIVDGPLKGTYWSHDGDTFLSVQPSKAGDPPKSGQAQYWLRVDDNKNFVWATIENTDVSKPDGPLFDRDLYLSEKASRI